jgi:hypothetical protein
MSEEDNAPKEQKEPVPFTLTKMSDDDLKKFVIDFVESKIFADFMIRDKDPTSLVTVFMPLAFGALSDAPEEELKKIGILWEYNDKAMPRSINGYPTFPSVRMMHIDDWNRVRPVIKEQLEKLKNIEIPKEAK